jgi:hypothetical protein
MDMAAEQALTVEEVDEPEPKERPPPLFSSSHIVLTAHEGDIALSGSGPSVYIPPSYSAASKALHVPEHSYSCMFTSTWTVKLFIY